jgi:hypothetical protein
VKRWPYALVVVLAAVLATVRSDRLANAQSLGGPSNYGLLATNNGVLPPTVVTTGTYTIPDGSCGGFYTNRGAVADVTFNLPVNVQMGCTEYFYAYSGGTNLIVKAPTGKTINLGSTASASGGTITFTAAVGGAIQLAMFGPTQWGQQNGAGAAPTTP